MKVEDTEVAVISRYRSLGGFYRIIFLAFTTGAVGISVVHIFGIVIAGRVMLEFAYLALLLTLLLPLVFLTLPASKRAPRDRIPWYDLVLAVAGLVGPGWAYLNAETAWVSAWELIPPPAGVAFGIMTWILVVEAIRRAFGIGLAIVVVIFSVSPLFTYLLPGFLTTKQYSLQRIVGFHFLGEASMLGLPMGVFGRILIGFLLFGVVLQVTGGAKFFLGFAMAILGHLRGGAAKVSVLSSAIMGMMSGSVISNVITTGAMTIPAMKKSGYPAYYAGAVEAASSTGGVMMPPVMGATAFIMAEFLGIPYASIIVAAFLPMVLYYASIYFQTDFQAVKLGLKGLPRSELPSIKATLKEGWFFIFSLLLLVFFLLYMRLEGQAPFYTIAALILTAMIRKETRLNLRKLVQFIEGSGHLLAELAPIMAGVGMVIGALMLTGIAHGFASGLTHTAGGNLILLLIMSAAACFVFGMGMTITAAYIFLALLVAPALVKMGIVPIAAHLFLLYYAMVSYITPPVATAAYTAAAMAGGTAWRTGWQAVRLGVVALFVPFIFVLNPALVAHGSLGQIGLSFFTQLVGILLLSGGIEAYMWRLGRLSWLMRLNFFAAGLLMIVPFWQLKLIGVALVVLGVILSLSAKRLHLITS